MKTKVFALLGGFTSLIQVFALCTPWWVIVLRDDRRYVYGLWYTLSCEMSDGVSFCQTLYHYDVDDVHDIISNFMEYQIETLVGAVVCLIGTVLCTVYKQRKEAKEALAYGLGGTLLLLTSGVAVWVAVGKLAKENADIAGHETVDIPWSLIIAAVSSIVPFILCAVMVPLLILNSRELQRDRVAARAMEDKVQSSTVNLYTTDISLDRLPGYLNMANTLTPAPSFSTLDSTVFPGDSLTSQSTKCGEIFL